MEPQEHIAQEEIERFLNSDRWFLDDILADPRFADLATAGPSPTEVFVVTLAMYLFGLVFPLAAFGFALVNRRRVPEARILFTSAMISSGLTLAAGLAIWLLPATRPDRGVTLDWRGYALTFLYAWTLLDFWRGAMRTRARPRALAAVAAACLLALAAAFILAAT